MQLKAFLSTIRQFFSSTEAQQILAALRQDALIWARFSDEVFRAQFTEFAQQDPDHWRPVNAAIFALDDEFETRALAADPQSAAPLPLQHAALEKLEDVRRGSPQPFTLRAAVLTALGLSEHFRAAGNWDAVFSSLPIVAGGNAASGWPTVLACLAGLVENWQPVQEALLRRIPAVFSVPAACHVILTNPAGQEEHLASLVDLLTQLPLEAQTLGIQYLLNFGRAHLAAQAAEQLAARADLEGYLAATWEGSSPDEIERKAQSLRHLADLQESCGNQPAASALRIKSRTFRSYVEEGLKIQRLERELPAMSTEQQQAVLAETFPTLPINPVLQEELILAVTGSPSGEAWLEQAPEDSPSAWVQFCRARHAHQTGDQSTAVDAAQRALALLHKQLAAGEPVLRRHFLVRWNPRTVIDLLSASALPNEAIQFAEILLTARPNDLELVEKLAELYASQSAALPTQEISQIAALLSPQDILVRRRLAALWEADEDWQNAYQERRDILHLADNPSEMDRAAFARCALETGELDEAIENCEAVLSSNPNHGPACLWMGRAMIEKDKPAPAIPYLSNATLLLPEEPLGWMLLAKAYQAEGQPRRAQETLQTAILTAPESADINYALGESYRAAGSLSEALPYLKRAATLDPGSLVATLDLAETLKALGYLKEAETFLREGRKKWPRDTELAYLEAETLLASGRDEAALPALEASVSQEAPSAARLMVYVRTLLRHTNPLLVYYPTLDHVRLSKAQSALDKLHNANPADIQTRIYLAELAGALGRLDAAYRYLEPVLEAQEAHHPQLKWRVQGDLGVIALHRDEVETALAALEQAVDEKPELIDLSRFLADAYTRADLKTEALQTAKTVLKMAPDDIRNLTWFAEIAIRLGRKEEAVNALRCATQLSADHPEFFIQLARLEWQVGDFTAARQTLQMLLALDYTTADHLQQGAVLFHKLGDSRLALTSLEQAAQLDEQDPAELQVQIAYLNQKMGRYEEALRSLQKALVTETRRIHLYVFQADLLAALQRYDAALACLEHALRLKEDLDLSTPPAPLEVIPPQDGIIPPAWVREMEKLSALHIRFAALLRQRNDLPLAFDHSVKALEICPESLELRYFAADVAGALLQTQDAADLATLPAGYAPFDEDEPAPMEEVEAWVALTCLRAELAFAEGEEILAGRLIQQAIAAAPENARVLAAQARLLARWGDFEMANECFVRAVTHYQHETGSLTAGNDAPLAGPYHPLNGRADPWHLWLSEAALELSRWEKAMQFMELYLRDMPPEPRASLLLAKIYILQAEQKRICEELDCVNHAPAPYVLDEAHYQKAAALLADAAGGASTEVRRWSLRHEAVFHLSLENVRRMMEENTHSEDLAQLVAALRWIGNNAGAIQIARRAAESPALLFQLALCFLNEDGDDALEVARKAVAARPNNPLVHTVLSRIASNCKMAELALQSIETALSFWPDEPAWHALAAQYSASLGGPQNTLSHREQAFELAPDNADYALELGKVYLELNNYSQAVEVLSKAVQLNPKQDDAWYRLACAYRQVGNLMKGMDCADRSASLNAEVVEPLLLSGEIALQLGRLNHALGYAKNALRRDCNHQPAIQFLVAVLKEQGESKKALRVIEKSLPTLAHPSMGLLLERSYLVLELNGPAEALPLLNELLEQEEDHPVVLRLLARAHFALGALELSEKHAQRSLQLAPDDSDLHLLLGRINAQGGNLDRAIHHLSESIRIAPLKLEPYLELAKTYQQRREDDKALQIYRKAIQLSNQDHRPYYQAGLILRERKAYVEAESMLRQASEMAPEDVNIRRQLGAVVALNLVHNTQEVRPLS